MEASLGEPSHSGKCQVDELDAEVIFNIIIKWKTHLLSCIISLLTW